MRPSDSPVTGLQQLVERLHAETGASRTTIRLDRPGEDFPVAAEALAPGIASIAGDLSFGIRGSGTVAHLAERQQLLIQPDLVNVDPPPAPELLAKYGARSQMLAPLLRDGELAGIVSVHWCGGPREWTPAEVAALEQATAEIAAAIGAQAPAGTVAR